MHVPIFAEISKLVDIPFMVFESKYFSIKNGARNPSPQLRSTLNRACLCGEAASLKGRQSVGEGGADFTAGRAHVWSRDADTGHPPLSEGRWGRTSRAEGSSAEDGGETPFAARGRPWRPPVLWVKK